MIKITLYVIRDKIVTLLRISDFCSAEEVRELAGLFLPPLHISKIASLNRLKNINKISKINFPNNGSIKEGKLSESHVHKSFYCHKGKRH